jgi:hypothetical protein
MNKIKQTIFLFGCALFLSAGIVFSTTSTVQADCGGVPTAIINCNAGEDPKAIRDSGLWEVLVIAINVLVGVVGVAALAGVIYGAVLYTSAGGNMEQTKKGMQIIGNVAIGVIAFGLMYVGLNFLVPGGVIG